MGPEVAAFQRCQRATDQRTQDLTIFGGVLDLSELLVGIFKCVDDWEGLRTEISTVPLLKLDVAGFGSKIKDLETVLGEIQGRSATPNSLVMEIRNPVNDYLPVLTIVADLARGQMQVCH